MEEFNLSEYIEWAWDKDKKNSFKAIDIYRIKKFLKILKDKIEYELLMDIQSGYINDELVDIQGDLKKIINRLSGDELK